MFRWYEAKVVYIWTYPSFKVILHEAGSSEALSGACDCSGDTLESDDGASPFWDLDNIADDVSITSQGGGVVGRTGVFSPRMGEVMGEVATLLVVIELADMLLGG